MKSCTFSDALKKAYSFDIAEWMGITEGALVNLRLGKNARRLNINNIKAFIGDLGGLGMIRSITRNPFAVSVQDGTLSNQYLNGYGKVQVGAEAGLILNPGKLDLRLFFKKWVHGFHIRSEREKCPESIQVFDGYGAAVNKIYLLPESNTAAFGQLLDKYREENQSPEHFAAREDEAHPAEIAERADRESIDRDWRAMKEVHDFYLLIRKYRLSRLALIRSVKGDLAWRVENRAIQDILTAAHRCHETLMLFVANAGCIQIYTGKIGKILIREDWLNLFNPGNKIHIRYKSIHESWVVRKPSGYGHVTSLEGYARDGEQILQIYGQRDEDAPERDAWRVMLDGLVRAA